MNRNATWMHHFVMNPLSTDRQFVTNMKMADSAKNNKDCCIKRLLQNLNTWDEKVHNFWCAALMLMTKARSFLEVSTFTLTIYKLLAIHRQTTYINTIAIFRHIIGKFRCTLPGLFADLLFHECASDRLLLAAEDKCTSI